MVEAYGGGSNEADFTALQQFLVAAGAGTYNQCIGIFYQLRSEVSAGSINHAVGYFFDGFLNKRYLVVNNDSHNAAVLFDDSPSCEDTTNPSKWLSNARKIIRLFPF